METLLTDRPEILDPTTGTIKRGTVTYYMDLLQGSDEWLAARLGILTASEMKKILTPTFAPAPRPPCIRPSIFKSSNALPKPQKRSKPCLTALYRHACP